LREDEEEGRRRPRGTGEERAAVFLRFFSCFSFSALLGLFPLAQADELADERHSIRG
jgi:hypothetical protein